jgi:hypothetical protein
MVPSLFPSANSSLSSKPRKGKPDSYIKNSRRRKHGPPAHIK